MLSNIIDKRERKYRWKRVHAAIEPTCHDNGIADADQAVQSQDPNLVCEDRSGISIGEAVKWAITQKAEVTLYLYDFDKMFGADDEEVLE